MLLFGLSCRPNFENYHSNQQQNQDSEYGTGSINENINQRCGSAVDKKLMKFIGSRVETAPQYGNQEEAEKFAGLYFFLQSIRYFTQTAVEYTETQHAQNCILCEVGAFSYKFINGLYVVLLERLRKGLEVFDYDLTYYGADGL